MWHRVCWEDDAQQVLSPLPFYPQTSPELTGSQAERQVEHGVLGFPYTMCLMICEYLHICTCINMDVYS